MAFRALWSAFAYLLAFTYTTNTLPSANLDYTDVTASQFSLGNGDAPETAVLVPPGDLDFMIPFVQFSWAAYCGGGRNQEKLVQWRCGKPCDAHPEFYPSLVGGNGGKTIQTYFVGYWSTQDAILVVHQGTGTLYGWATDATAVTRPLNSTLFPGSPSGAKVHTGFNKQFQYSADPVFAEVNKLASLYRTKKVLVTGHSMGAAIAALTALSLKLRLTPDFQIVLRNFGAPRTGNVQFAQWFESNVPDSIRVINNRDLIPVVLPRNLSVFYNYLHPGGELHINVDTYHGNAYQCSGLDNNQNSQCRNAFDIARMLNHLGPYQGITILPNAC